MKNISLVIVWILCGQLAMAQLSGVITNEKGEALPFASVYIQNSSIGTTSNQEGKYVLQIPKGQHKVVFQYVGYEQKVETVDISTSRVLDVQLQKLNVKLTEVTVTADGEDPAYAIIRKAMAKRKYYLHQVKKYTCNAYVKGRQRLEDVPEKILGMEVGDLGGMLDSTRSGILYLSESISEVEFQTPDQYREKMISSKVSGDDNGFSFNQASMFNFNFYKNTYSEIFDTDVVSPIASNAFRYYRYKLAGAFVDKSGQLVNKIQVLRKRNTDPTMSGYIYINEDLWNIHSIDLMADGNTFSNDMIDSLTFRQMNIPIENDVWLPLSSSIVFQFNFWGITVDGLYSGMFSKYNLHPNIDTKRSKNELLKVEANANKKDSSYWAAVRPIPLTLEEINDYNKKDSLQTIWNSKEFQDSLDKESNQFKAPNMLSGYTYINRKASWSLRFHSPLSTISYNTVQGYHPHLNLTYKKTLDKDKYRYWSLGVSTLYGFSDKQFRGTLDYLFRFNSTNRATFQIKGGRMAEQFNKGEAIDDAWNASISLLGKRNYAKFYDKYFIAPQFSSEISNGIYLKSSLEYAHRIALKNTTDDSWFYRESRKFTSNHPLEPNNPEDTPFFQPHQALTLGIDVTFKFKQKYISYPNRKIILGSRYPSLHLTYRKGLPVFGGDTDYDFASLAVKDKVKAGTWGSFSYRVEGGIFLTKAKVPFIDFHHFKGQKIWVYQTSTALTQFRMLDYYQHSTTQPYAQFQWEHSFGGFVLRKIPLIRHLQGKLVLGNNILYSESTQLYTEWIIGIDAFRPLRVFRIDFVTQIQQGDKRPSYTVMIGTNL